MAEASDIVLNIRSLVGYKSNELQSKYNLSCIQWNLFTLLREMRLSALTELSQSRFGWRICLQCFQDVELLWQYRLHPPMNFLRSWNRFQAPCWSTSPEM